MKQFKLTLVTLFAAATVFALPAGAFAAHGGHKGSGPQPLRRTGSRLRPATAYTAGSSGAVTTPAGTVVTSV